MANAAVAIIISITTIGRIDEITLKYWTIRAKYNLLIE
jgi:hypothetical protein